MQTVSISFAYSNAPYAACQKEVVEAFRRQESPLLRENQFRTFTELQGRMLPPYLVKPISGSLLHAAVPLWIVVHPEIQFDF